jgi:hypothetical protein
VADLTVLIAIASATVWLKRAAMPMRGAPSNPLAIDSRFAASQVARRGYVEA